MTILVVLPICRENYKLRQIIYMETEYFLLGQPEGSNFLKIVRILFGIVCLGIALFWMIFNIRSSKEDRTLWITVFFLSGFGFYQIWAGVGRATRFIQIQADKIILRKNSFLPQKELVASELKKIEIFPLNLIFYFNKGGKTILRFGTSFIDVIEPIKIKTEEFAGLNKIDFEIIEEEL